MTESTANAIIDEVLRISNRLANGTLPSRLCPDCGDVRHYGRSCDPVPVNARPDYEGKRLRPKPTV